MARPRKISDDRILEVAREAFLDHGPSISTTTIADRLGISQSVLFQRFGSKERLLLEALVPNGRPAVLEKLRAGPDQREVVLQLLVIAEELLRYFRETLPAMMVLRQAGLDLRELAPKGELPVPLEIHEELTRWFRRAQSQGRVRRGDPAAIALAFQGALQIQPTMAHMTTELFAPMEERAYLRDVVEVFWWGLDSGAQRQVA